MNRIFPVFSTFLAVVAAVAAVAVAAAESPLPLHRQIDALIDKGAGNAPMAELADDAEFFRRVNLDFAGAIPAEKELRAFLADSSPDKRQKAIGRLLNGPRYAATMRDRFHIHLMERRGDDAKWLAWLEAAFAENRPWDQMVREILRADFRDEKNRGAAYFYSKRLERYGQNPTDFPGLTRDVGRMFLGMDLQCAECHKHLLIDDYDQVDFQGLMAAFSRLKLLREEYPAVEEQLTTKKHEYSSVFVGKPRFVGPKVPGLEEIELVSFDKEQQYVQAPDRKTKTPGIPRFSPLQEFAARFPEAPTFAANIANRVWFLMMGRGLVEPLDQFHSENPPSHPELLDLLAAEFAKQNYDLKWLQRELALTRTYQRSSRLPDGVERVADDRFVAAVERRLSAEQLLASTLRAANVKPEDAPLDNVEAEDDDGEEFVGLRERFHNAFAGEAREPELQFAPSLKGAMFAMNDAEVAKLLHRPDALPAKLAAETDDAKVAEALFLNVLSRTPDEAEIAELSEFLAEFGGNRAQAIAEATWAMLVSTEFVANH